MKEVKDWTEAREARPALNGYSPGTSPAYGLRRRPRPMPQGRALGRPLPIAEPSAATGSVGPEQGESQPATSPEESFRLVDADGVVTEVIGIERVRAQFERILFDPHLSPEQIIGVWQWNKRARAAIERHFGRAGLESAEQHMRSADLGQQRGTAPGDAADRNEPPTGPSAGEIEGAPAPGLPSRETMPDRDAPLPGPSAADSNGPRTPDARQQDVPSELRGHQTPPQPAAAGIKEPQWAAVRTAKESPLADRTRALAIDPGWGDRRVFRYYRARLAALRSNGSGGICAIARFRDANSAIETRLRTKLPQLMQEIDALYG